MSCSSLYMDRETQLSQEHGASPCHMVEGSWIIRNDIYKFDCGISYHAVVETIQSGNEATLVIGRRSNGIPLMWHENWDRENYQFCRVLLRVSLHSEEDQPYGKVTRLYNLLNRGDYLVVRLRPNYDGLQPNLFSYYAASAWKMKFSYPMKNNVEKVSSPLRGRVENIYENDQVGLINFGTYDGGVAKAVFFTSDLYVRGEKYCGSLNSITSIGTELFLEVTSLNFQRITEDWEIDLRKVGANYIATRVWLKGDQSSSRASSGSSTNVVAKTNEENGVCRNDDSSKINSFSFPKRSTHKQTVFKGVLECFIDLRSALVCVAHRSFTPLDLTDDWCDESVCLERVVLNCCDLTPSELDAPFSKDTVLASVVNVGDYLELTLEPYEKSPEQCYKWRAITCCKIEVPKLQLNTVSVHSLASDYLCGTIESVMEHDEGIINFITYTGFPAKAYFRREHFFSGNVPYMSGECLSNNVVIGTQVKLIVRTRLHENNEKDRNLLKEGVLFTAIKVWFTGNVKLLEKNMNESDFGHEPFPSCSSKEGFENSKNEMVIYKDSAKKSNRKRLKKSEKMLSKVTDETEKYLNRKVFKGVVEYFLGSYSALVCVAHRGFTPLNFNDDWCAKDVCLERVILTSCHLKSSEFGEHFPKKTFIQNVISVGDYLELVPVPFAKKPNACYKWLAETCWKTNITKLKQCTVSLHSLTSNYLCGTVDSIIESGKGIINFITHFGQPAKAYFKDEYLYCGQNPSFPQRYWSNDVVAGTKVNLIVRPRRHEDSKFDKFLLKEGVLFTAVIVWTRGEPLPQVEKIIHNHQQQFATSEGLRKPMTERVLNEFNIQNKSGKGAKHEIRKSHPVLDRKDNIFNENENSSSNVCGGVEVINISNSSSHVLEYNEKENSDILSDIQGILISLDGSHGLVEVEDEILSFQSSNAYLFGIWLQDIPLHKVFHIGLRVKVYIHSNKVLRLSLGCTQPYKLMKYSILAYCDLKKIAADAREMLVTMVGRQTRCYVIPKKPSKKRLLAIAEANKKTGKTWDYHSVIRRSAEILSVPSDI